MFFGGLVGAETCCQTVQKVGEVPWYVFRPEIVEAVCGGPVTVRRTRRFQGVSEPSFRLEIHGSAGCSLGRDTRPQHQKSKIQERCRSSSQCPEEARDVRFRAREKIFATMQCIWTRCERRGLARDGSSGRILAARRCSVQPL